MTKDSKPMHYCYNPVDRASQMLNSLCLTIRPKPNLPCN